MLGNLANLATAIKRAEAQKKQALFVERRTEPRLWCSEIVQIWYKDPAQGRWRRKGIGVLEDISRSGACVQLETPLTSGWLVRIKHPQWKVEGQVRYCLYRDQGYFIGLQLAEEFRWNEAEFKPQHLLDPSRIKPRKRTEK